MSKRAQPQSRGRARSGGGITSNKLRQVGQRVNPRSVDDVSLAGVDALGQQLATKRPDLYKRQAQDFAPMGNALTNNVGKGGPGTGRTLYGQCGSQGMHGKPSYGEGGGRIERDILSEFGPERSKG